MHVSGRPILRIFTYMVEKDLNQKENETKIATLLEDLNFLEAYVSDIFNFMPAPLAFVSVLGVVLEINPAFTKISKYNPEEIIGEEVEKLFNQKNIQKLIQKTLKEGSIEGEKAKFFPKRNKKGIPVQVFAKVRYDQDKNKLGVYLSLFDLTEIEKALVSLKQAKNDAEEEKNKTLAIIQNFVDGLLVFDENEILVSANSRVEDFLNINTKSLIGKSLKELTKIKNLKKAINIFNQEQVFREELKLNNLVLEVTAIPITGGSKNQGTLVILHDITRESLIEEMKSEFVSLAAHQLRTPLSAIKWITKMLLDEELGELNEEQKEFLEDSYESNDRMISLINDLLNVTKIEEGRYLYKLSVGDVTEIIKFVINSHKDAARKKNLKVIFNKPKRKIPPFKMDVEKIKIVIENLLDNAIKYTDKGKITIELKKIGNQVQISVSDSGVGIQKKHYPRMFEKFFRSPEVVKMETEGSGLGLFITKNIIEAHGGKIWFESQLNKGTTFYFTIPIK